MISHPVPKVGDTVHLNDFGLNQLYGTSIGLSAMKKVDLKITYISNKSLTAPEQTFVVEVDDEGINQLMIDHWMFDIVKSA